MAYTSYPFDNQDTTEAQYSALFRELQDSGVIDGYGGTALQIGANSSAMSVTMQPGSALVRGHKFDSDATDTLTIGAAGGAVRYDAVILRLDPVSNTILPVVVANAGATPALTQTTTGIFEILLAVVTVNAGAVTIAAGDVADKRLFVRHRVGVWASTNRPASPRPYQIGMAADKGGRIEHYDPATTAWVSRVPVYWGSGAAYPTQGVQAADTFVNTNLGPSLMRYNGTAWRQTEPVRVANLAARDAISSGYAASLYDGFQVVTTDTGSTHTYFAGVGWYILGEWVTQVRNNTYTYDLGTYGNPPAMVHAADIKVPSGRTLEVEFSASQVILGPSAQAFFELWIGAPGLVDGATLGNGAGTNSSFLLKLGYGYQNKTGATQTSGYSIATAVSTGAGSINAGAHGWVTLRHRIV